MSKTYVGARAQSMDIGAEVPNITRVNLVVDSEHMYTAGDDTGRTLEVECPWGTQAMADSILAGVSGVQYRPYTAERALLDPAFEIGDAVTVGGLYSVIASADCTYNAAGLVNIGAPDLDEIDDEYPAQQTQGNSIKRQLAYTRSLISKTSEQIRMEVQGVEDEISYIELDLEAITSRVQDAEGNIATLELTATSLQSEISGKIDGDYAQTLIDQTLEDIELSVSSSEGSTTFTLKAGEAVLSTKTLNLTVDAVNITGTLRIGNLPDNVATTDNIESVVEDIADNKGYVTERGITTIVEGIVTTDYLYALGVVATELRGFTVTLADEEGDEIGGIDLYYYDRKETVDLYSNEVLWLTGGRSAVMMAGDFEQFLSVDNDGAYTSNDFSSQYAGSLGGAAMPWDTLYSDSCTCCTSDENRKHSIETLPNKYLIMFDYLLPYRFKMNNGTSGRYHPGYTAQNVKEAMDIAGIDSTEFGGWIKDVDKDGNEIYMLRYEEFGAIYAAKIKQIEARMDKLEGKTNEV